MMLRSCLAVWLVLVAVVHSCCGQGRAESKLFKGKPQSVEEMLLFFPFEVSQWRLESSRVAVQGCVLYSGGWRQAAWLVLRVREAAWCRTAGSWQRGARGFASRVVAVLAGSVEGFSLHFRLPRLWSERGEADD